MAKPKYHLWWEEKVSESKAYGNAEFLSQIPGVYAIHDRYAYPYAEMRLDAIDKRSFKKALRIIITMRGEVLGNVYGVILNGQGYDSSNDPEITNWNYLEENYL